MAVVTICFKKCFALGKYSIIRDKTNEDKACKEPNYEIFVRPSVWYNGFDGLKFGMHANGNYLNTKHIFDATLWFSSGIGQSYLTDQHINSHDMVSILLNYKTATDKFMKKSTFSASLRELDGLSAASVTFEKSFIEFFISLI